MRGTTLQLLCVLACLFFVSLSQSFAQVIEEKTPSQFHELKGAQANATYLIMSKNGEYREHGKLNGTQLPVQKLTAGVYYVKTLSSYGRNTSFAYVKGGAI